MKEYGKELILDLHHCSEERMTRKNIRNFCSSLCQKIDMKKETLVFWDDEGLPPEECQTNPKTTGISAVQFILTSNITIHTLPKLKKVFLNIFSCKDFDNRVVRDLSEIYFDGRIIQIMEIKRL